MIYNQSKIKQLNENNFYQPYHKDNGNRAFTTLHITIGRKNPKNIFVSRSIQYENKYLWGL